MPEQPTLHTERLILRPLVLDDTKDFQRLAGDWAIASTTRVPHPYEDGMAETWITARQEAFYSGKGVTFAIVHKEQSLLVGTIALNPINKENETSTLGYWMGKPYWNQGYCTEAAKAVLKYGFEVLHLNRIFATHIAP